MHIAQCLTNLRLNILHQWFYYTDVQDTRTESHTLPDGLLLKESAICNAGLGVFTAPDFTIKKDRIFGPYAGVIVVNQIEAHESGYCWQV